MTRIGLLADTHGYLDPLIWKYFDSCDELWHAGDFGTPEVVESLRAFRPLRGVFGNIDDVHVRDVMPEHLQFECEGVRVWMTHIGGRPGRYAPGIRKQIVEMRPHLFVCGHSHVLQVERDQSVGGTLYLNPGAAGHQGFHLLRTMLRFELDGQQARNMQIVELGPRGRIPVVESKRLLSPSAPDSVDAAPISQKGDARDARDAQDRP